ncbi:MAG TPA: ATP-binding protein [Gammaproteobacteria bacterium]|nr:ATP-binding protein [Gammaproteobacteria bacterium]
MSAQGCPCGHLGDASRACRCTSEQVSRYRARISGPLLDRIDLHVEVPRPKNPVAQGPESVTSVAIASRVEAARAMQIERTGVSNAWLKPKAIEAVCRLNPAEGDLLNAAMRRFGLSERGRHRVLKVARTIADLAAEPEINSAHLSEAVGFRVLDRDSEDF